MRPRLRAALATLLVGGAAYAGLFLLLTAEDRRENARSLELHGPALLDAPSAGNPPDASDAAAFSRWKRAAALREDRLDHERRTKKVRYLAFGLLGAFVVQAGVTAALLVKSSRARP